MRRRWSGIGTATFPAAWPRSIATKSAARCAARKRLRDIRWYFVEGLDAVPAATDDLLALMEQNPEKLEQLTPEVRAVARYSLGGAARRFSSPGLLGDRRRESGGLRGI